MSFYKTAPWERSVTVTTVVVVALMVISTGALLSLVARLAPAGWLSTALVIAVAVSLLGPLAALAVLRPTGYRLTERGILVTRPGPAVVIPAADITGVEEATGDAFEGAMRLAASGGVFGYWGLWHSRRWGNFRAYATRRGGVVVVHRRHGDPVLLTPDRPAELVAEARRRYGAGAGSTE